MTTVESSLASLEAYKEKIVGRQGKVYPGMPMAFSEACTAGDRIWQGDLALTIADQDTPLGFARMDKQDGQLVPGNTQGAKHVIEDMSTCEIYYPQGWDDKYDKLTGPFLRCVKETKVIHPTHGPVTIPAGMSVQCSYQRVWEQELAKERRQRD